MKIGFQILLQNCNETYLFLVPRPCRLENILCEISVLFYAESLPLPLGVVDIFFDRDEEFSVIFVWNLVQLDGDEFSGMMLTPSSEPGCMQKAQLLTTSTPSLVLH